MASRPYHSPVRDQRSAETHAAILDALAEVIASHGVAGLSVQQVADRAGVAHRTVYRHFPDRQAMLDAYGGWVQQQLSEALAGVALGEPEDYLEAIPRVFDGFDQMATRVAAMVRLSVAENAQSALHRERTERFRELLGPALTGYADPEAVFAVVRHLLSALTWWVLREEFSLGGERAGRAVAAVIGVVLEHGAD